MLIARLKDSIEAEAEQEERRERELRCAIAQKVRDLEVLKAIYHLQMDRVEDAITLEGANIGLDESALQAEEKRFSEALAEREAQLAALSLQQAADADFASVRQMLELTERRDQAQKRIGELEAAVALQEEEIAETHRRTQENEEATYRTELGTIRSKLASVRQAQPTASEVESALLVPMLPSADAFPSLAAIEERRTAARQSLQAKRREWKQSEAALISSCEEERKAPTDPQPAVSTGVSSPKRPYFRPKDAVKPAEVDLESLLGNAGPSLERIKEVAQQYRVRDSSD